MAEWYEVNGTNDLDHRTPESLMRWQRLMLDNYCGRGDTPRIIEIRRQLPGLVPGLWRTPGKGESMIWIANGGPPPMSFCLPAVSTLATWVRSTRTCPGI